VIKPYAEDVLKVIRQYDPDNLVIVGTPHWSQEVDVAASKSILDTNIAYAFHFYSSDGWHKQNLRNKVLGAMKKGAPIFITEYGLSKADGNGAIDTVETTKWFSFVDEYELSTCNWSIMDKEETSAALKPGANAIGHWNISDLNMSGVFIRNRIRALNEKIFQFLDTETKKK
jgi:endoglucanase